MTADDEAMAMLVQVLWRIKAAVNAESPMQRRDEADPTEVVPGD